MSIRLFSSLLAGRRWRVVLLAASSIAAALAEALVLVIVVQVALAITDGKDRVDLELGPLDWSVAVGTIFAIGLALVAVRLALQLVAEYLPARMSTDVQEQLRKTIFERFVHTSWDVQSREREGHLQELLTAQISRVAAAVLLAGEALAQGFNFVTLLISALILNPPAAASIAIAVVALFFVMRPLARLARDQSRRHAAQGVEYAATISESVRVGAEVQAFGVAEQQRRAVDRRVEGVSRYLFRTSFLAGVVRAAYQNVAISLVLCGLAVVYLTGSKEVASLGAVTLILIRALGYSQGAQSYYHRANELVPYIERINERQSLYEDNRVRSGDRPLARIDELGFDGVSFEYEVGVPVLRNVTFRIPRGEATGLIGPTGAGKSTLVQIILRLREPSAGELLVNGQPSANFRLEDWRRLVAFLPQDPQLLNGTVSENIRFLREDIRDEDVESAARLANIHDEICSWPSGYRTIVGQRAHAVSGGQRQRICLARALVTRPSVLVLDEPTSALDVRSESLIQRSLAESKSEMTIVCIAHRLSTLNLCDRIIVLREGSLEAFDTPESLVRSNGFYREAVELSRLP